MFLLLVDQTKIGCANKVLCFKYTLFKNTDSDLFLAIFTFGYTVKRIPRSQTYCGLRQFEMRFAQIKWISQPENALILVTLFFSFPIGRSEFISPQKTESIRKSQSNDRIFYWIEWMHKANEIRTFVFGVNKIEFFFVYLFITIHSVLFFFVANIIFLFILRFLFVVVNHKTPRLLVDHNARKFMVTFAKCSFAII